MKSIILSAAFMILSVGIGLGMAYFILFDQVRSQTRLLLKRGLQETILQVSGLPIDQRSAQAMGIFMDFVRPDLIEGYATTVELMDINEDPLAIRIRISVVGGSPLFWMNIRTEETIVEVTQ